MGETERVWEDHSDLIRRVARAEVGDPQMVDDVVAEAAERWFRAAGRDGFEIDDRARAYVLKIVRNVAIDHGRRRQRDRSRARRALPGVARLGPAERSVRDEELAAVREALNALSDRHRTAMVLADVEGLTHVVAAEAMGMRRSAFTRLLARARRDLRSQYLNVQFGGAVGECVEAQRALIDGSVDGSRQHMETCQRCIACRDELAGFGIRFGGLLPLAATSPLSYPGPSTAPRHLGRVLSAVGGSLAGVVAAAGLVAALTSDPPDTAHDAHQPDRPALAAPPLSAGPTEPSDDEVDELDTPPGDADGSADAAGVSPSADHVEVHGGPSSANDADVIANVPGVIEGGVGPVVPPEPGGDSVPMVDVYVDIGDEPLTVAVPAVDGAPPLANAAIAATSDRVGLDVQLLPR